MAGLKDEEMIVGRELRRSRKRWLALGIAVPAMAIALPVGLLSASGAGQSPGARTTSTTTTTAGWNQAVQKVAARAPEPTLPPAQRQLWIADFDAQATCMHAHGVPDFPEAPSTFGDGRTPPPVVGGPSGSGMDPQSATFQAAQKACPFNTSNLTAAAFEAAWGQVNAARASSTSTTTPATGN